MLYSKGGRAVHFEKSGYVSGALTACGRWVPHTKAHTDPGKVSCRTCRRTETWRKARAEDKSGFTYRGAGFKDEQGGRRT